MIEELFRDHPGGAAVCAITILGVLTMLVLAGRAWRVYRGVRAGDEQVAFMARDGLAGVLALLAMAVVLCLLSLRGLASTIEAIHALPPAQRAAALHRARHLTTAQYEVVGLYLGLIALVLGEGVRQLWNRRRFDRKYGDRARKPKGDPGIWISAEPGTTGEFGEDRD